MFKRMGGSLDRVPVAEVTVENGPLERVTLEVGDWSR